MIIRKKAFTLIELLVVVSIIALLVSILLPALGRARQQARQVLCAMNIKSLGQAAIVFAGDNDGRLVRAGSLASDGTLSGPWGSGYPGAPFWDARLLPYLGATNFDPGEDGHYATAQEVKDVGETIFDIFLCPAVELVQKQEVASIRSNPDVRKSYPRSYKINGMITGHGQATGAYATDADFMNMAYRRAMSLSSIKQPAATLLFIDTEIGNNHSWNSQYGWTARSWFDVRPTHDVEYAPFEGYNPWNSPASFGFSNFAFADGHVEHLRCQFTQYVNADPATVDWVDAIPGVKFTARGTW